MSGKRIYLDDRHRARQHNVFAAMIIVGLIAVFAIWFVQIRLMVNKRDIARVGADVAAMRDAFGNAFSTTSGEAGSPAEPGRATRGGSAGQPLDHSTTNETTTQTAVQAAVGAAVVDALAQPDTTTTNSEPQTTNTTP